MRLKVLLGRAIASLAILNGYTIPPSQAIQLQDGTVYFVQPPRLVETVTTYNQVNVWGATYYFTVNLPENASEPLQKLTINQHQGVDNIRFDLKNSFAFEGTRSHRGQRIGLKDAADNRQTRTVSLIFDPPVSPGKTITIGLKPWQNPTISGVYLFGVTAFPAGEKTHSQFLGFGRLHFYNHSSGRFPFW
ncbi:DUF2808 domain-containing protein [Anabaena sp. FACHB-709]|uniref:DUF2808 domain-containing protein n=2 Tax=Nostocaceae TaxID=1162 RepID=A0A1Z4KLQ5_ANAVA|nr:MULTISPECIES: DUF2808 domain-containing protein [Nostocaceae]BAY69909.1 hypothetical protein NIES23_27090 [Trichormus variabilis NIES-23]HBW33407.1 DUF2808 domain-containing protein [Nostoc sp. UBA8866]MBD2173636.1 DUF2808 domain-containing protein [Anabaena cylindrica FACHB-318]MBD2265285.1 DUF2808 domain-containing protein [Anabaena sp. FACHB-709]MBD2275277.1 DUF2808 domain-containing protein [Nostoc sp. PCC 7120 = FACHB-418]